MRIITPGILALTLIMASCQPQNPSSEVEEKSTAVSTTQLKKTIQALEDTLAMAYNTKNVELFSRFYADDAITYGEGREQLFGKKELVDHFRMTAMQDSTGRQFEYLTIDLFHKGNLAIENGKWIQKDATGYELDHGFYMVVFKKADGQWRSIRDIWNSSTIGTETDEAVEEVNEE